MESLIAVAAILMPFLSAFVEIVKPLLPKPADTARQDSIVRVATAAFGVALSLAVFFFTAAVYSRFALGQAIAEGGIAALMATGLWHGLMGIAGAASTVRIGAAPAPTPATPAFPPIGNDPLNPAAGVPLHPELNPPPAA